MARPSSNVDIEMIKAGRMIIETEGVEAVTIRNVCNLACVNTGLFNYYFSTKENFFIKLLDNIHEEFSDFVKYDSVIPENEYKNLDPLCKLRHSLNKMLIFVINKEKLMVSIFYDLLLKNQEILKKIGKHYFEKHIIVKLISECIDAGYFKTNLPPIEIFTIFALGGFSFQHAIFAGEYDAEHTKNRAALRKERVNIILKGLLNKGDAL